VDYANTRLMEEISDVDYEQADVDWMEMATDNDSDSHDSD